jgi:hypothetical protein
MPGWRTMGLVWLVAAVLASGCNDDDESLSREDYQAAITHLVRDSIEPIDLYTDLVVQPRSPEECASMLASFEEQVGDLVERVAELRPPLPVRVIHNDFVAAARRSRGRIHGVRAQVVAGQVSCGDALNRVLYAMPAFRKAKQAIARLERRGYVVLGQ